MKDHTKSAVMTFNIKHFIWMQTQRFKSSVTVNHADNAVRTSNLAVTLGVTYLNFQGTKTKLRGLSPHANYTDRAAATGR